MGGCENCVYKLKRQELVFDTFSYFEPLKTAYDVSVITGFRSFDSTHSSTRETALGLLEVCYLRATDIVVKRIIITKFGVNNGGDNGRGCLEIR